MIVEGYIFRNCLI